MTKKGIFKIIGGIAIGGFVGFLYWRVIGCNAGSCPLTSNPYNTVMLFAAMGGFVAYDNRRKEKETN